MISALQEPLLDYLMEFMALVQCNLLVLNMEKKFIKYKNIWGTGWFGVLSFYINSETSSKSTALPRLLNNVGTEIQSKEFQNQKRV